MPDTTSDSDETIPQMQTGLIKTLSRDHKFVHGSSIDTSPQTAKDSPTHVTIEEKRSPWETCLEYAKDHPDKEMALWKEEVANLLIFAGLFSGVVAAFAIESYHDVKGDPAEKSVLLLEKILAVQVNATIVHQTLPDVGVLSPRPPISSSARRVVIFNFLSLVLSVSTAMAGILCLQWIREYSRNPSGVPGSRREHLGIRFMRRQGLEKWHVFRILTSLPFSLLLATVFFFIGLMDLLLSVDRTAGAVISAVIGLFLIFLLFTTISPCFQLITNWGQCPYKSPQSRIFYQLRRLMSHWSCWRRRSADGGSVKDSGQWDWSDYDLEVYNELRDKNAAGVAHGLHSLGQMHLQDRKFAEAFYDCIQDPDIPTDLLQRNLEGADKARADLIEKVLRYKPRATSTGTLSEEEKKQQKHKRARDMAIFQTLAHLVERIEGDQPSAILLNQRIHLFLKLNEPPDAESPPVVAGHTDNVQGSAQVTNGAQTIAGANVAQDPSSTNGQPSVAEHEVLNANTNHAMPGDVGTDNEQTLLLSPQPATMSEEFNVADFVFVDCPLLSMHDLRDASLIPPDMRDNLRNRITTMLNRDVHWDGSYLLAIQRIFEFEFERPDNNVRDFEDMENTLSGWVTRARKRLDQEGNAEADERKGEISKVDKLQKYIGLLRRLKIRSLAASRRAVSSV
ncbi:hypothetical protein NP233_g8161 [Leucocoprinus birnbaumii]|uniref:DUF6535 domain-containing protein n=1 Tax=Leucocoprinus birnbaumii TaxID=56174 RepID=A0AAD5VMW5_9AGAR|nr:hypothetical protein NP233_g8161 [Leucocoprinus birnbaumii]